MTDTTRQGLGPLVRRLLQISWTYRWYVFGGWVCLGIQAGLMALLTQIMVPLINISTGSPDAGERTLLRLRNALEPIQLWEPLDQMWHSVLGSLPSFMRLENDRQMAVIATCLGLGLSIAVARAVFIRWGYILTHFVSFRALTDLRAQVNSVLLGQRLAYYDRWRPGELISKLQNDMETMGKSLIFVCNEAPKAVSIILAGIITALYQVPTLAAVLFAAPLFWLPLKKLGKMVKRSSRHTLQMKGELTNDMHQQFGGMREIKGFQQEARRTELFAQSNNSVFDGYIGIIRARALARAIVEGGGFSLAFITISAAVFISIRYGITFGEFFALGFIVTAMIMNPLRTVSRAYNNFQESLPGAESILGILDNPEPLVQAERTTSLPANPETIQFDHIHYRYLDDADHVVIDFSLTVKRGEVIALVGPTGSGKSTLVDFLPRFRDPTQGVVRFDSVDLRDAPIHEVRERVALVTQDPYLFNISVRDNLRLGNAEADDETLWAILNTVNLADVVKDKGGLDVPVGERGSKFSGGQRQRLAIARAMLKDAPILILDEATSSQDSVTESELQEALETLMQGRTTFVIAHRLATVRHADRVCVLKDGRLIEEGTHDSLKGTDGEYARLYSTQFADT